MLGFRVQGSPVRCEFEVVEVQHIRADGVQKVTSVTNNQQGLGPLQQVILQMYLGFRHIYFS